MASANQKLTKGWIQYLKNNQIVGLKSNPRSGRLDYKRQPTVTDLTSYLGKDYDEDAILDAIQQVLGSNGNNDDTETADNGLATQGSRDPSTWHQSEVTPGTPLGAIGNNPAQKQSSRKNFNTDDAEDAKYSQRGVVPRNNSTDPSTWHNSEITPNAQDQIGAQMPWKSKPKKYNTDNAQDAQVKDRLPKKIGTTPSGIPGPSGSDKPISPEDTPPKRKPRFKYRYKKGQLKEAIRDNQGAELSEKEVQSIFKILSTAKPAKEPTSMASTNSSNTTTTNTSQIDLEEQVRKLKRVIRDEMTDQQRSALYRALTDV